MYYIVNIHTSQIGFEKLNSCDSILTFTQN